MAAKSKVKNIPLIFLVLGIIFFLGSIIISVYSMNNKRYNRVVVSYSTDHNYIYPTVVSMTSLMENAYKDTFCEFVILISSDLSGEDKIKLEAIHKNYCNCNVRLIDMGQQYSNAEEAAWTKAMYYRLNLPEILAGEKKCIYLDGDTIVRHDIYEMMKIDISKCYVAGIRDMNSDINKNSTYHKVLGISDLNSYICSGVLIMNLEKMRNDNIKVALNEIISKNNTGKAFRYPDQDAINCACFGHILPLPFKYGALIANDLTKSYQKSEYAQWISNEKDWNEGRTDPLIVHFTVVKPWENRHSDYLHEWWGYVYKTNIKEEIKSKYNHDYLS